MPSPAPRHPSPAPLFAIRTPTAIVTDLGTEFGAEVGNRGKSNVVVYQGKVKVQGMLGNEIDGQPMILTASQVAVVEKNDAGNGVRVVRGQSLAPSKISAGRYARLMPLRLSLVDIVSGGNGLGDRRTSTIDSSDPMSSPPPTDSPDQSRTGDGCYHRVPFLPGIDGVFIPKGGKEPVQVDSAGHTFNRFPHTDNTAFHFINVGGPLALVGFPPFETTLGGIDYAVGNHTVLYMHSNQGITFDLNVIRKNHPSLQICRFTAITGRGDCLNATPAADAWVLVDGQERFSKLGFPVRTGPLAIDVELKNSDRFLTLVTTDGGDGCGGDRVIFGDPGLEAVALGSDTTMAGVETPVSHHQSRENKSEESRKGGVQ